MKELLQQEDQAIVAPPDQGLSDSDLMKRSLQNDGVIDSYGFATDQSRMGMSGSEDAESTGFVSSQYHGVGHAIADSVKSSTVRTAKGFATSFGRDTAVEYLDRVAADHPDWAMPDKQGIAGWLAYQGANGIVTTAPSVAVGAFAPAGIGIGVIRAMQGATTFAQLFGDNYEKAMKDTGNMASPWAILGASALNTMVQSGIEIGMGPQRWLSDSLGRSITGRMTRETATKYGILSATGLLPKFPKMLSSGLEEGAEEGLQLLSDDITGKLLSGKDMSDAGQYLQNFAAGAWGGLLMGGGATIIDHVAATRTANTLNKMAAEPTPEDLVKIAAPHLDPVVAANPQARQMAQEQFIAQEDAVFTAFGETLEPEMRAVVPVIRNIAYGLSAADNGVTRPSEFVETLKVAFLNESKMEPGQLASMQQQLGEAQSDGDRLKILRQNFTGFDRVVKSAEQIIELKKRTEFNDQLEKANKGGVGQMDEKTKGSFVNMITAVASKIHGESTLAPQIDRKSMINLLMDEDLTMESLRAIVLSGGIDGIKIGSKTYRAELNADFSLSFTESATPQAAAKDRAVDATVLATLKDSGKGGLRASKTEIEIAKQQIRAQELARQKEMLDTLEAMDGKMTPEERLQYLADRQNAQAKMDMINRQLAELKKRDAEPVAGETPEAVSERKVEIKSFEDMAAELEAQNRMPERNTSATDRRAKRDQRFSAMDQSQKIKQGLARGFTAQDLDAMSDDEVIMAAQVAGLKPTGTKETMPDTPEGKAGFASQARVRLLSAYPRGGAGALFQRKESRLSDDQRAAFDTTGMYLRDSRLAVFYADADMETVVHEWFHHMSTSGLLPSKYAAILNDHWAHDKNGRTIGDLRREYEAKGEVPPPDEELRKLVRWTNVSEENAVREFLATVRDQKIADPKLAEVFDLVRNTFAKVYQRVGQEYVDGGVLSEKMEKPDSVVQAEEYAKNIPALKLVKIRDDGDIDTSYIEGTHIFKTKEGDIIVTSKEDGQWDMESIYNSDVNTFDEGSISNPAAIERLSEELSAIRQTILSESIDRLIDLPDNVANPIWKFNEENRTTIGEYQFIEFINNAADKLNADLRKAGQKPLYEKKNISVASELVFGTNAPLWGEYPGLANATPEAKAEVTRLAAEAILPVLKEELGDDVVGSTYGEGGWMKGVSPNVVTEYRTIEAATKGADLVGAAWQQDGMMIAKAEDGGTDSMMIFGKADGADLTMEERKNAYSVIEELIYPVMLEMNPDSVIGFTQVNKGEQNPEQMMIAQPFASTEQTAELLGKVWNNIKATVKERFNIDLDYAVQSGTVVFRNKDEHYKWETGDANNRSESRTENGVSGVVGRLQAATRGVLDEAKRQGLFERRAKGGSGQDEGAVRQGAESVGQGVNDTGEIIGLTHYSNEKGLKILDPKFGGRGGLPGAERARQQAYPEIYQNRVYVYLGKHTKEAGLGASKYTAKLDTGILYDYQSDPAGIIEETYAKMLESGDYGPADRQALDTLAERAVKDAGYAGLKYLSNEAILFHPITPGDTVTAATHGDQWGVDQGGRDLQRGQRAGNAVSGSRKRTASGALREGSTDQSSQAIGFSPEVAAELEQAFKPVTGETLGNIIGDGLYRTMRYRTTFEQGLMPDERLEILAKSVATGVPAAPRSGNVNPLWEKKEPKTRSGYQAQIHAIFSSEDDKDLTHSKASDFVKTFVNDQYGRAITSMTEASDEELAAATDAAQRQYGRGKTPITNELVARMTGLNMNLEELKLYNPEIYNRVVELIEAMAPGEKTGSKIKDMAYEADMLADVQKGLHGLRPLRPTVAGGPDVFTNLKSGIKRGLQSLVSNTFGLFDMCKYLDDANENVMKSPVSFTQMVWSRIRDANHAIAKKYLPVEQEYAEKVRTGKFFADSNKVFTLDNGEKYSYNEMLVIYSLANGSMVNPSQLEIKTNSGKTAIRPEYRNLAAWILSNVGTESADIAKAVQTANQIVAKINGTADLKAKAVAEIEWQNAKGKEFFAEAAEKYSKWNGGKIIKSMSGMYTPLVRMTGDIHEADLASVFENVDGAQPNFDSLDSLRELHHRQGFKGGMLKLDYRGNFLRHIEGMSTYSNKRDIVAETLAMLGNESLSRALDKRFGSERIIVKNFRTLIEREMRPSGTWSDFTFGNKVTGNVMQNVYASVFPFNIMTVPTQLTSISNGLAEMGLSPQAIKNAAVHFANVAAHVTKNITRAKAGEVSHLLEGNAIYEEVRKYSPSLLRRFPVAEAETYRRNQNFLSKHVPGWSKMIEEGNLFMELGDMGAVLPTWKTVFDAKVKEISMNPGEMSVEQIRQKAANAAYDAVVQSQNPSTMSEKSLMQTGPGLLKAIIPFSGQTFVLWHNMINDVVLPITQALQDGQGATGKAIGIGKVIANKQFLMKYAGRFIIPAILMGMVARRRPPEDMKEIFQDMYVYPLTAIPVLGNVIWAKMFLGYGSGGPIAFWETLATESVDAISKINENGGLTSEELAKLARTGALGAGVPQQFLRIANTAIDVASKDDKTFDWEAVKKTLGLNERK